MQRNYPRHTTQKKDTMRLKKFIWVKIQKPGRGIKNTDPGEGSALSLETGDSDYFKEIDIIQEQDVMTDLILKEIDLLGGEKDETVVINQKAYKDNPILQDALDASVIVAQRMQRL